MSSEFPQRRKPASISEQSGFGLIARWFQAIMRHVWVNTKLNDAMTCNVI